MIIFCSSFIPTIRLKITRRDIGGAIEKNVKSIFTLIQIELTEFIACYLSEERVVQSGCNFVGSF